MDKSSISPELARIVGPELNRHQTFLQAVIVAAEPVAAQDFDERKQAELSLRESQRALATLMDNLPGMAYRCRNDQNWTMEFVSEGAFDLTGYAPSELVDNREVSYAELIRAEDRERVQLEVQAALQARVAFRGGGGGGATGKVPLGS